MTLAKVLLNPRRKDLAVIRSRERRQNLTAQFRRTCKLEIRVIILCPPLKLLRGPLIRSNLILLMFCLRSLIPALDGKTWISSPFGSTRARTPFGVTRRNPWTRKLTIRLRRNVRLILLLSRLRRSRPTRSVIVVHWEIGRRLTGYARYSYLQAEKHRPPIRVTITRSARWRMALLVRRRNPARRIAFTTRQRESRLSLASTLVRLCPCRTTTRQKRPWRILVGPLTKRRVLALCIISRSTPLTLLTWAWRTLREARILCTTKLAWMAT